MQESSQALIERYYAAFNAGDMTTFLGLLADEVVHDINQGQREIGKQAFTTFMQSMNQCYREQIADIAIMVNAAGDRVAAEFTVLGEYLVSSAGLPTAHGQTYRLPAGAFFEVRAGKIRRVTNYYNLTNWTAQVSG